MKKTIHIFALLLTFCLVFGVGAFSAGSSYTKELLAKYVGVQLIVEGKTITPKDANGNVVEPFIVDGTTYLPVRAVAEALGKDVSWDGSTKTVYIGEKQATAEPLQSPIEEVKIDLHNIIPIRYSFLRINGNTYEILYSYESKTSQSNIIYQDENNPSVLYLDSNMGKDMWSNAITYSLLTHSYKTTTPDNPYVDGAIDLFSTYYNSSTIVITDQKHYTGATDSFYTTQHSYQGKTLDIPTELDENDKTVKEIDGIKYCGQYINVEDYCFYFSLNVSIEVVYDETLKQTILDVRY